MPREFNEATAIVHIKKDGTIDWIRVSGESCESTDPEMVKSRAAAHAQDDQGNVIQPPSVPWDGATTLAAFALAQKAAIEAASVPPGD